MISAFCAAFAVLLSLRTSLLQNTWISGYRGTSVLLSLRTSLLQN